MFKFPCEAFTPGVGKRPGMNLLDGVTGWDISGGGKDDGATDWDIIGGGKGVGGSCG